MKSRYCFAKESKILLTWAMYRTLLFVLNFWHFLPSPSILCNVESLDLNDMKHDGGDHGKVLDWSTESKSAETRRVPVLRGRRRRLGSMNRRASSTYFTIVCTVTRLAIYYTRYNWLIVGGFRVHFCWLWKLSIFTSKTRNG